MPDLVADGAIKGVDGHVDVDVLPAVGLIGQADGVDGVFNVPHRHKPHAALAHGVFHLTEEAVRIQGQRPIQRFQHPGDGVGFVLQRPLVGGGDGGVPHGVTGLLRLRRQ